MLSVRVGVGAVFAIPLRPARMGFVGYRASASQAIAGPSSHYLGGAEAGTALLANVWNEELSRPRTLVKAIGVPE